MRAPSWMLKLRLQRRLFLWFGVTILLTSVAVSAVHQASGTGEASWRAEVTRMRNFTRGRFERLWDRPAERDELAMAMHRQLDVDVVLTDPQGTVLASFGDRCTRPSLRMDIQRAHAPVGNVLVCTDRHKGIGPGRFLLMMLLAASIVWGASGFIARRIARPLAELARVARDIGEGKLSSRVDLAHRERGEVGLLADVLDEMASRVERQMADQRALLATVSHEIRTPLARMRLLVEMARDRAGDLAELEKIDREVVEIDALVSELLASSRVDFSAMSPTSLQASRVATEALERADVDPTVLEVDDDVRFLGDATLVGRAVLNLVQNARRHGGGVVALRVCKAGLAVRFEVHDSGPGITPGDEDKIFQPFYRGGEGRVASPGSVGLGLSLVRRIAEAHGGRAFAANRPEGGAMVAVELALDGKGTALAASASRFGEYCS